MIGNANTWSDTASFWQYTCTLRYCDVTPKRCCRGVAKSMSASLEIFNFATYRVSHWKVIRPTLTTELLRILPFQSCQGSRHTKEGAKIKLRHALFGDLLSNNYKTNVAKGEGTIIVSVYLSYLIFYWSLNRPCQRSDRGFSMPYLTAISIANRGQVESRNKFQFVSNM